MGNRNSVADGWRGVLQLVVLAVARVAGLSRGGGGSGSVAIDLRGARRTGFRRGTALRVGLRLDRTWHTGPDCASQEPGHSRVLPLRAESDVRGFCGGWTGLWMVFGRADLAAIVLVCAVAFGVHVFVTRYEEPTLRKTFGGEYEEYCRNVNRWLPRAKAWSPAVTDRSHFRA